MLSLYERPQWGGHMENTPPGHSLGKGTYMAAVLVVTTQKAAASAEF